VPYDTPKARLDKILANIQGFIFPDETKGAAFDSTKEGVQKTISYIIEYSKSLKDKNNTDFPLFGIGTGMLHIIASTSSPSLITTDHWEKPTDKVITVDATALNSSLFFGKLSQVSRDYAFSEGSMYVAYQNSITRASLETTEGKAMADEFLTVGWFMADDAESDEDANGQLLALVEHKKYPWYGSIFQPQATQYERIPDNRFLDRSPKAIRFVLDMADTFVEMARITSSTFETFPSWLRTHFYHYSTPVNSFPSGFERVYIFPRLYTGHEGLTELKKESLASGSLPHIGDIVQPNFLSTS